MDGLFDEARRLYRRGRLTLEELGGGIDADSTSIDSSRVELLAGDLEAAERELQRDDAALAAIDERYFRSTITAILAGVRWLRGDPDEALRLSEVAESIADADDVWSQVAWRAARAKVLAGRGDVAAAATAEAAVQLAAGTEDVALHADALADLGEVLELLGRHADAGPPIREALALYEQKGDRVSAARIRRRLTEAVAG
jgi:ATP/maltotriose-dependent transcriptional regulator MalT